MDSKPELYDTHCHLDFSEFDEALDVLLQDCREQNITKFLLPSVSRASWAKGQRIADRYSQVAFAAGLHPLFIADHSVDDLSLLRRLISDNADRVVAVGEIGLDAEAGQMEFQESLFSKQLDLAVDYDLPVIMHARRTHSQLLSGLKRVNVRGVIHAFSGSAELLNQYVAKGIGIGVGCVITWSSANRTRDAIAKAPLSSLFIETDSPDMKVQGSVQNEYGSPLDIRKVFLTLCDIRSESPEVLANALRENADRIFFDRI